MWVGFPLAILSRSCYHNLKDTCSLPQTVHFPPIDLKACMFILSGYVKTHVNYEQTTDTKVFDHVNVTNGNEFIPQAPLVQHFYFCSHAWCVLMT